MPADQQAAAIISLSSLPLKEVTLSDGQLRIGSAVTAQDLIENPLIPAALKAAAAQIVNRNVRNMATIGGNIALRASSCNLAAMLLALDAKVELATEQGTVVKPISDYFSEKNCSALITALIVPESRCQAHWATRRYVRTQNDISIILADAVFDIVDGKVKNLRCVMGGVAPTATRLTELEARLEGYPLPERDKIVAMSQPLFRTISDFRGSAAFKREVGSQMMAWVLHKAAGIITAEDYPRGGEGK